MNKKSIVISSIIVSILVLGTITSSYAYFQSRLATGSSTSMIVKANTISGLAFNAGNNINLLITQTNMARGLSDLTASTEASVILKSRNDVSDNYYYKTRLNISSNNFVHSSVSSTETSANTWGFGTSGTLTQNDTDDSSVVTISNIQIEEGSTATQYDQYGYIASPELVLTVIKNDTIVLTQDIASTKKEICVPTTNGGSTLTHNIFASANTTTDTWKATVTFKNLSTNQNTNTSKELSANFVFTKI